MLRKNQNIILTFAVIIVALTLLGYGVCCIEKQPVTSTGSAYGIFVNQVALANPTAVTFLVIVALTGLMGLSIVKDHFRSNKVDFDEIAAEIKEKKR